MKTTLVIPRKGQLKTSAQKNSEHLFILKMTMSAKPHGKGLRARRHYILSLQTLHATLADHDIDHVVEAIEPSCMLHSHPQK